MSEKPVSEKFRKFTWTPQKDQAAQLLAEDEFTDEEIATALGITARTLYHWKEHPDFTKRIKEIVDRLGRAGVRRAIARRARRVRELDKRWQGMQQVIAERSADPTMQNVPGGKTGLLTRTYKGIGTGDNFQLVQEYEVDTGLLKELRDHEKQAAQELGQWAEKKEITGADGGPIVIEVIEAVKPHGQRTD